jgi:hypothetical protein
MSESSVSQDGRGTEPTVQSLAEAAARQFTRAQREDGEVYTRLKEGAPDWIKEAVKSAHEEGEILPDDWIWKTAGEAFDFIWGTQDASNMEDAASEFADNIDPYTGGLLDWYGSCTHRAAYVEQAREEGLITASMDISQQLAAGQYLERQSIYNAVMSALLEQLADPDDDPKVPANGAERKAEQ